MKTLILAGGAGTRLRSLVNDRPKPMACIKGKPFLEHQIEFLKTHDLSHFVLCVGYRHEVIQKYFEDGRRWNVSIEYSLEQSPLGTGGALRNARAFIDGAFVLLNGDSFFDVDVRKLVRFHGRKRSEDPRTLGSLALTRVADARSYGSVQLGDRDKIVEFEEKAQSAGTNQISAGIYVLEPQVLELIPAAQQISLERQTLPTVLNNGGSLFGFAADGFFVDIGTPDGFFTFKNFIEGRQQ